MFELIDKAPQNAVIKVIGVGGGGGNAVKHMIDHNVEGVDFICANTDAQALTTSSRARCCSSAATSPRAWAPVPIRRSAAPRRWRIGSGSPSRCAVPTWCLSPPAWVAVPVPAARRWWRKWPGELGILTVAVVTRPFTFEGRKRGSIADKGLMELQQHVDSLITIPNEKLLEVLGKNTSLLDAFKEANDVLLGAVQGIADLIIRPGMINVDFADVRTVMSEMGMAMMGTGSSRGENRAREAAERAINSPLLDDIDLEGAPRDSGQYYCRAGSFPWRVFRGGRHD
jgi:cell division protein FtsZ